MLNFRDSLKKIGEPEPNKPIPPFPSGFHSSPQSLKAAMHAMNYPLIESWTCDQIDNFANKDWTEECQGITTDGNFWYIVSNNNEKRAIYKFSLDFNIINLAVYPEEHHIGHPAFGNGKIYVPVEPDKAGNIPARVWVLDTNLNSFGTFELGGNVKPQRGKMPWYAVNPWNGCLYSSVFDGVNRVYAYDPNNLFSYVGELSIQGDTVNGIQGGCVSINGKLYPSSDSTKNLLAYSIFNGAFLGSCIIPDDEGLPHKDEIEGLTIGQISHSGRSPTYMHVIVLDNDWFNRDDVDMMHFTVPDPSII